MGERSPVSAWRDAETPPRSANGHWMAGVRLREIRLESARTIAGHTGSFAWLRAR